MKKFYKCEEGKITEIDQCKIPKETKKNGYGTDFIICRARNKKTALIIAKKYDNSLFKINNNFAGGYFDQAGVREGCEESTGIGYYFL